MQIKPKRCKGTGKAINFVGCNDLQLNRKYGLGIKCGCFAKFLYETKEGSEIIEKNTLRAKNNIDRKNNQEWKEEKKTFKKNDKKYQKSRRGVLQDLINEIARFIDFDNTCMMCEIPLTRGVDEIHGCHYHSVGSNESLRYNLFNDWLGCYPCNKPKGGNKDGYDETLIKHYGEEKWEYIKFEIKRKYQSINLSANDIEDLIIKAREIRNELKKDLFKRTLEERWELRQEINEKLNIYK